MPLNTNTTHIGRNIHGYLEKYPPCTFQTQTRGVELRKFQVLGSRKNFRANFFFVTPPLRGYPPKKGVRRYQEFFSTPPPLAPSLPGARATPAQPASGGGCLPQPRWSVCATGAGAHSGKTSRDGEKGIWWTGGTSCGGTGHLGLTHTETQRGRLWTACGQRRVESKNSQTTLATTSTSSIRQVLGAADAQTAHHATFSTAPTHQLLGSANAEPTPARAPAAAADRKQQPNATCEGKNG